MTKQHVARFCIWISFALVIFAALATTIDPQTFPLSHVLRIDVPAVISIVSGRYYLLHHRAP